MPIQRNTFDVAIMIPLTDKLPPFSLGAVQVVESALKVQGIDALVGRDVLQHSLLVYDGRANIFSMAFEATFPCNPARDPVQPGTCLYSRRSLKEPVEFGRIRRGFQTVHEFGITSGADV